MSLNATATTGNPSAVVRHRIIHMFIHSKFPFSTVPGGAFEARTHLVRLLQRVEAGGRFAIRGADPVSSQMTNASSGSSPTTAGSGAWP